LLVPSRQIFFTFFQEASVSSAKDREGSNMLRQKPTRLELKSEEIEEYKKEHSQKSAEETKKSVAERIGYVKPDKK